MLRSCAVRPGVGAPRTLHVTTRVASRRFFAKEASGSQSDPAHAEKGPSASASPSGAAPTKEKKRAGATEAASKTAQGSASAESKAPAAAPAASEKPAKQPLKTADSASKSDSAATKAKVASKDEKSAKDREPTSSKSTEKKKKDDDGVIKKGKGKANDEDEEAGGKSQTAEEKQKARKLAKKERAEAEADEKDKQKEIPLDEIEAEGEFVPPKAEKMTPLEVAELMRRATELAARGSDLIKAEKYNEAEGLVQTAFYQLKELLPEHHPKMLRITLELAFLYQVHGRKDVALAHYEKGAPHWASMLGKDSKEYGSLLANWAEILGTTGKHVEAEAKVKEALAVLQPLFPADHELLGGLEANLAAYQASQQKWDEAYQTSTKALKMLEKSLGAGHDYTIFCLENLLKMLNDQGKTDTVEELKLIWGQKTKRPFRVLTQADVDKLMPTEADLAKIPEQPVVPPTPRSKPFTPPGKMITPEAFTAEMTAFWQKVQEKGLDVNPAMQNVVLEDLVRAKVISHQEKAALLERKREQLSALILEKIKSFTPEQTKLMVRQYMQVQEDTSEVSQWDNQGHAVDAFTVFRDEAAKGKQ